MKDDVVRKLQRMYPILGPMKPVTLRLPAKVEKEIKEFCDKHEIRFSVLIREAAERGWESIKADTKSSS
jgi:hypothetical protein